MRAGRIDRRITIQAPVETQSESGEIITTWGDVATVWGELVPLPGSERFATQQLVGHSLMTWKIRYSSTTSQITSKYRLVIKGRVHEITDVRETRRNEEIQIDCFAASEQPIDAGGAPIELEEGGELLLED